MSDTDHSEWRNARFMDIIRMRDVQDDLAESKTLRLVIEGLKQDADQALLELADINPGDVNAVTKLKSRVCAAVYLRTVIDTIMRRGAAAEQMLHEQDGIPP